MPTPWPDEYQVDRDPPGPAEVEILSRGVVAAVTPDDGLTETQRLLVESLFDSMTGYPVTLDGEPLGPQAFGRALARRNR